jgi:hypothetical protein
MQARLYRWMAVSVSIAAMSACGGGSVAPPPDTPTAKDPSPCASGEFFWGGPNVGGFPPDTIGPRRKGGDERCFTLCTSDAECTDAARPHCSVQGWQRGDMLCADKVQVCSAVRDNKC